MPITAYFYDHATVARWVDGDTVDITVDVGFRARFDIRFRLFGVDTPEHGQPNHDEAVALVNKLAPAGTAVTLFSYGQDKYGRWLADVTVNGTDIDQALIKAGLAVPYFGGSKATAWSSAGAPSAEPSSSAPGIPAPALP